MSLSRETELLLLAAGKPIGIVIAVGGDIRLAITRLSRARTECPDEGVRRLQIRRSPNLPNQELWITHGERKKDG